MCRSDVRTKTMRRAKAPHAKSHHIDFTNPRAAQTTTVKIKTDASTMSTTQFIKSSFLTSGHREVPWL